MDPETNFNKVWFYKWTVFKSMEEEHILSDKNKIDLKVDWKGTSHRNDMEKDVTLGI